MATNTYANNSGSLFRLKNGSSLNVSNFTSMSSGEDAPTFILESGSVLNLVGEGNIASSGAPIFHITDSKINVSGLDRLQSSNSSTIVAEDSSVIISNVRSLSGVTPISIRGECHVTLNRLIDIVVNGDDNVFLSSSETAFGSLKLQNIGLIPGSFQIGNMNATLSNVRVVRSSGSNPAITFIADSADGNYTLIVEGPTALEGTDALYIANSVCDMRNVVLNGDTSVTNSVANFNNSSLSGTTAVLDSTISGVRTLFDTLSLTDSHCTVKNSTIVDLTPSNSSVVSYHSKIDGNLYGTMNSAVWLNNSRVGGSSTVDNGSSLISNGSKLDGSGSATSGFIGIYGGVFGTVVTASRGMALAFGSSVGSIDGAVDSVDAVEHCNVLSAEGGLSVRSGTLHVQTVGDTHLHVGGAWLLTVAGMATENITGLYKATVTSTYDIDATGVVTIKGSTVNI